MRIALIANGPGEVWGWSRPFILEAARRGWETDIHLQPCPYASGREFEAVKCLPARSFSYGSSASMLLRFLDLPRYDAVMQFGGDLMFGRFLAWRQGIPLACYSYGRKQGMKKCAVVMTSRPGLYETDRLEVVGDLVRDGLVTARESGWTAPAGKRICVFPGSRPKIRAKAFYLLNGIRSRLAELDPEIELRVMLSPFSDPDEKPYWEKEGYSVWQGPTAAGLAGSDLALTQPGTNTLELMYCEQPFAVTIPFSFIRQMPVSGLLGILGHIPVLGPAARERYIKTRLPRYIGRTAWPNRLAGEMFAPELIGEYTASDLAESVAEILKDTEGLARQRKRLHELASQVSEGAPARICETLERMIGNGRQ